MSIAAILDLLVKYGPSAVSLAQQLIKNIEAGKNSLTSAELQAMIAISQKTSAQYLADAGGPPAAA